MLMMSRRKFRVSWWFHTEMIKIKFKKSFPNFKKKPISSSSEIPTQSCKNTELLQNRLNHMLKPAETVIGRPSAGELWSLCTQHDLWQFVTSDFLYTKCSTFREVPSNLTHIQKSRNYHLQITSVFYKLSLNVGQQYRPKCPVTAKEQKL